MAWYLYIWWFANIEKSIVIHDTGCLHWNQVYLNNIELHIPTYSDPSCCGAIVRICVPCSSFAHSWMEQELQLCFIMEMPIQLYRRCHMKVGFLHSIILKIIALRLLNWMYDNNFFLNGCTAWYSETTIAAEWNSNDGNIQRLEKCYVCFLYCTPKVLLCGCCNDICKGIFIRVVVTRNQIDMEILYTEMDLECCKCLTLLQFSMLLYAPGRSVLFLVLCIQKHYVVPITMTYTWQASPLWAIQ